MSVVISPVTLIYFVWLLDELIFMYEYGTADQNYAILTDITKLLW